MLPRTWTTRINRRQARLALYAGLGTTVVVAGLSTAALAHGGSAQPGPTLHVGSPATPAPTGPQPTEPVPTTPAPAKAAPAKAAPANAAPVKAAPAKPAAVVQAAAKSCGNNLDGWIAEARDILSAHGDKVPSAAAIKARALTESSGNPKAENHWDANEAAYGGTYGLIQTIKPTFAAYSLPGHKDILHPVDSVIAGVRYANDRYGSFEAIAYAKTGY
ncbi:transglycosylase SLT domain-containing protein [Streptacidiphilus fuscans]|uniref:Transglycosylase SLT domain-containing protein n=1 Tax=Streptacidiphilus fuscans TaxID=2789292 RepID=A0A931B7Y7_9ACTN|nr:transglycosylase SLT domain-containing protein [Streptacidiphilus fuscans]MBF9072779.1 transglycosylase SLT domain-containing protein [Streptacidiphilus fuscans]